MSEITMLVPLNLELIDEGSFMENANKALLNLQAQLAEHVNTYGHKAKGAKAKLSIEIVLGCIDTEHGAYGCASQIKTTMPSAPPSVSMLMSGSTQTGEGCLLCKKSGSSKDSPKQGKFLTVDGRKIDPITGEVIDQSSFIEPAKVVEAAKA